MKHDDLMDMGWNMEMIATNMAKGLLKICNTFLLIMAWFENR